MKWISSRHISGNAATILAVFGIYFASYFLVWSIITPVQEAVIPDVTKFASLLFLPHGVRVFATSLLREKAIPGIFAAEAAGNYLFWDLSSPFPLLMVSFASATATWFVCEGLKTLRIHPYYLEINAEPPSLQVLLLVAILASAVNAFLVTATLEGGMTLGHVTPVIAAFMTGDITGFLAVTMAAKFIVPRLSRGLE